MPVRDDADMYDRWHDAALAAALFAIDPHGLGGIVLRGQPGPVRDRWLSIVTSFLPKGRRPRRLPLHAGPDRLLGGLDLSATLATGRPIVERGLLASSDGGVLILAMAERLPEQTAAIIASVLDQGEVHLEREGFASRDAARLGVIAFDEALDDEERPSAALRDRLAFELALDGLSFRDSARTDTTAAQIQEARNRLSQVSIADEHLEGLTAAASALGIISLRAPLHAARVAIASSALHGRSDVQDEDAAIAARLVLAHRATRLPMEEPDSQDEADDVEPPEQDIPDQTDRGGDPSERPLEDRLLAAALAALPPGLLDSLRGGPTPYRGSSSCGKTGADKKGHERGRPAGIQPGKLSQGKRLSVIDTLRAAAPWQPLRRRERLTETPWRLHVRPEDFRLVRRKQPDRTTTIFVVDASGSSALQRLAEAKGAVELLLAECYARRDQVALLAFRGEGAEVLLPPTRSLVRAKRSLATLPGGGGTPLASGVQAAFQLADGVRRRGETPLLVFLTDGRGNIALDGKRGRLRAMADATASAKLIAAAGQTALVVDISARPGPEAEALAEALHARYLPLPRADATSLSSMVMAARHL
jgi:magnesium chelatase subunit D